jgi:hypothetical protein
MLPKTHAILGAVFSIIICFIFHISFFNAFLIFFASVFIDFDHYIWYVHRKKSFSLKNAYNLLKKESKKKHKPMLHIFHTLEFMILVFILSFFWQGFLFIFIGMIFHSALDIGNFIYEGKYSAREHFLIRYLILRQKYPNRYY